MPVFIKDSPRKDDDARNLLIASDGPVAAANCKSETIKPKLRERFSGNITWSWMQLHLRETRAYVRACVHYVSCDAAILECVYVYYNVHWIANDISVGSLRRKKHLLTSFFLSTLFSTICFSSLPVLQIYTYTHIRRLFVKKRRYLSPLPPSPPFLSVLS